MRPRRRMRKTSGKGRVAGLGAGRGAGSGVGARVLIAECPPPGLGKATGPRQRQHRRRRALGIKDSRSARRSRGAGHRGATAAFPRGQPDLGAPRLSRHRIRQAHAWTKRVVVSGGRGEVKEGGDGPVVEAGGAPSLLTAPPRAPTATHPSPWTVTGAPPTPSILLPPPVPPLEAPFFKPLPRPGHCGRARVGETTPLLPFHLPPATAPPLLSLVAAPSPLRPPPSLPVDAGTGLLSLLNRGGPEV